MPISKELIMPKEVTANNHETVLLAMNQREDIAKSAALRRLFDYKFLVRDAQRKFPRVTEWEIRHHIEGREAWYSEEHGGYDTTSEKLLHVIDQRDEYKMNRVIEWATIGEITLIPVKRIAKHDHSFNRGLVFIPPFTMVAEYLISVSRIQNASSRFSNSWYPLEGIVALAVTPFATSGFYMDFRVDRGIIWSPKAKAALEGYGAELKHSAEIDHILKNIGVRFTMGHFGGGIKG